MKYKIGITEKMKSIVEVNARSVTEALEKAERMYCDDKTETGKLQGVEFVVMLGENKSVCKEGKISEA